MFMFEGRETPNGIIALVIDEVTRLGGLRNAFPHDGFVLLYSGPDKDFRPESASACIKFVGQEITNGDRTAAQKKEAGWDKAVRIDDTPVGDFLFTRNNLYQWLHHVYRNELDDKKRGDLVDHDAKEVMTLVSALFARTAYGHVKTAICGASRSRVFYETELPNLLDHPALSPEATALVQELIDNKEIETINSVPSEVFRAIYKRDGIEAVYQRICTTELRERWQHAQSTSNDTDYADYLDRLEIHRINQFEYKVKHTPAPHPSIYQDLQKPEAERINDRTAKIVNFKTAKAAAVGKTTAIPTPPLRRIAGIPGYVCPLP